MTENYNKQYYETHKEDLKQRASERYRAKVGYPSIINKGGRPKKYLTIEDEKNARHLAQIKYREKVKKLLKENKSKPI